MHNALEQVKKLYEELERLNIDHVHMNRIS
jgi:hypothetical protein